jgi:hypothetical protein
MAHFAALIDDLAAKTISRYIIFALVFRIKA